MNSSTVEGASMSALVNVAISSDYVAVLAEGAIAVQAMDVSPVSKAVIEHVTANFSAAEGVTPLKEEEASAFPYGRKLFTGMESTVEWWNAPLYTDEAASKELWAAAADLVAANGGGSDLSDALRAMALAFTAEPVKVVLTVEYETPRPLRKPAV
jgi:hypothetical protein